MGKTIVAAVGCIMVNTIVMPAFSMLCWNCLAPKLSLPQLGYIDMIVVHLFISSLLPMRIKIPVE